MDLSFDGNHAAEPPGNLIGFRGTADDASFGHTDTEARKQLFGLEFMDLHEA